ncbi:hypothetical protein VNO77_19355 [Canavalia gladiata]|uniref:Uncharacterized protein n=1 Tax=Canavalia gladiata TaxID=3824 RepID=A0AAN9LMA1_CANGL
MRNSTISGLGLIGTKIDYQCIQARGPMRDWMYLVQSSSYTLEYGLIQLARSLTARMRLGNLFERFTAWVFEKRELLLGGFEPISQGAFHSSFGMRQWTLPRTKLWINVQRQVTRACYGINAYQLGLFVLSSRANPSVSRFRGSCLVFYPEFPIKFAFVLAMNRHVFDDSLLPRMKSQVRMELFRGI